MSTNSSWIWPQGPTDWNDIVRQLQQTEQRLQTALAQIDAMQKQLDELQKKPPIHVEYHFDQLKVSRLDGTLNIGLTPQGQQGEVDSLETPLPGTWSIPAQPPTDETSEQIGTLQQQAMTFMDQNGPDELLRMSAQHQVELEPEQMHAVIQDVKAQLKERVHHYGRSAPYPQTGTEEEKRQWNLSVVQKTKRDILAAFDSYLRHRRGMKPEGG
ncbi:spore germination protein GerPC [Cohnella sp. REN36]|uniref:spore germination protein GerPC n=1 Tax=Cohnella sp. REN36 TaxID=2887347 RepID=UPI001D149840|nr:spore germination protein GerPC [Cohnella sp. REN36]MCC3373357.1 spore germination protein GerPC [Cohnella sp. REN36]